MFKIKQYGPTVPSAVINAVCSYLKSFKFCLQSLESQRLSLIETTLWLFMCVTAYMLHVYSHYVKQASHQ